MTEWAFVEVKIISGHRNDMAIRQGPIIFTTWNSINNNPVKHFVSNFFHDRFQNDGFHQVDFNQDNMP